MERTGQDSELGRAEMLIAARRPEQAAAIAYACAARQPDDPRALLVAARAELGLKRHEQAEAAAARAASLAPDLPHAHRLVAIARTNRAYHATTTVSRAELARKALPPAREAVRLAPHDVASLWSLAEAGAVARRMKEAIRAADTAVALAPSSPHTWMVRARVARLAGDLAVAEAAAREALRLDPAHVQATTELAVVLRQGGRTGESLRQFAATAALDPTADGVQEILIRYGAIPFVLLTLLVLSPLAAVSGLLWLGVMMGVQLVAWSWGPTRRLIERSALAFALWRARRRPRRDRRQLPPGAPIQRYRNWLPMIFATFVASVILAVVTIVPIASRGSLGSLGEAIVFGSLSVALPIAMFHGFRRPRAAAHDFESEPSRA